MRRPLVGAGRQRQVRGRAAEHVGHQHHAFARYRPHRRRRRFRPAWRCGHGHPRSRWRGPRPACPRHVRPPRDTPAPARHAPRSRFRSSACSPSLRRAASLPPCVPVPGDVLTPASRLLQAHCPLFPPRQPTGVALRCSQSRWRGAPCPRPDGPEAETAAGPATSGRTRQSAGRLRTKACDRRIAAVQRAQRRLPNGDSPGSGSRRSCRRRAARPRL